MADDVSVRDLCNHTSDVLRGVEAGQRLVVTVDRRPVAELVPLAGPSAWVAKTRVIDNLVQADPELRLELDSALSDTVDEL